MYMLQDTCMINLQCILYIQFKRLKKLYRFEIRVYTRVLTHLKHVKVFNSFSLLSQKLPFKISAHYNM